MIFPNENMKERFVVQITGEGMEISSNGCPPLRFSACDALMLLDILRAEEENLRRIADEASPLPFRIEFTPASSSPPTDGE